MSSASRARPGEDFIDHLLLALSIFAIELFQGRLDRGRLRFASANIHQEAIVDRGPRPLVKPIPLPHQAIRLSLGRKSVLAL